jgi:hypothetical protein
MRLLTIAELMHLTRKELQDLQAWNQQLREDSNERHIAMINLRNICRVLARDDRHGSWEAGPQGRFNGFGYLKTARRLNCVCLGLWPRANTVSE